MSKKIANNETTTSNKYPITLWSTTSRMSKESRATKVTESVLITYWLLGSVYFKMLFTHIDLLDKVKVSTISVLSRKYKDFIKIFNRNILQYTYD